MTSDSRPSRLAFSLPLEPARLLRGRQRIRDYLHEHGVTSTDSDAIVLAIEEAMTNAVRHSGAREELEVRVRFEGDDLVTEVRDQGGGFDVESFDPERTPDLFESGGRGLYLIAHLMDDMDLRRDGGLTVRAVKRGVLHQRSYEAAGTASLEARIPGAQAYRDARQMTLLEEIDEGFAAFDWEYRYVHVNEAALRMLGRPRDELLGHQPWDFWPAYRDSPAGKALRAAMELGRPSTVEQRSFPAGDWYETRVYPTASGISIYLREINQRKRNEQEREELLEREREALLRARRDRAFLTRILERLPYPVSYLDTYLVYRECNSAAAATVRLRPDQVIGQPAASILGADSEVLGHLRRVLESGESYSATIEFTPPGSSVSAHYQASYVADIDEHGHILGVLTNVVDVTDLRESEQRFRSLFESMTEGVAVHELIYDGAQAADYRILDVNPSFERQTGVRAEDVRGRLASEVYGTGDPPYLAEYTRVVESGEPFSFETYFEPMRRHFQITAVSPAPRRFATVFEDITRRKLIEQERERLLDELRPGRER